MAELTIQTPDGQARTVRLHRSELLLGRDPGCDLVLADPACSRRHLRIFPAQVDEYVIEDLGSHNGTYVNRRRVTTHMLQHGDEIRAGRSVLRFVDRASQQPATVVISDKHVEDGTISVYRSDTAACESRLSQFLKLTHQLVGTFDQRELLERAMDVCMETLRFQRGLIVEVPPRTGPWEVSVVRNVGRGEGCCELTVSRSILRRAIERRERTVINNAMAGSHDVTESMIEHRIYSAMCVPISWQDEVLGALYGDRLTAGQEYTEQDVNFLAGLATQIGAALKTSQLVQEVQSRQQLEDELAVARQIQEGLFPREMPLRGDVEIVAFNNPGRSVSGDYYDVVPLDENRIGVVIADVSGKGVPAAMLMANLQAAVRVTLPGGDDLRAVVRRLNQLVYDNTDGGKFITALLAVFDLARHTVRYVNAGHYPPYRTRPDGRVEPLPHEAGLPLGVERDAEYRLVELPLGTEPCTLFMFTDGIPESLNQRDEFFGLGRIEELLGRNPATSPRDLVAQCRRAIAEFAGHAPQSDDVTLVVMRIGPHGG